VRISLLRPFPYSWRKIRGKSLEKEATDGKREIEAPNINWRK
jgi:hypothetical protein